MSASIVGMIDHAVLHPTQTAHDVKVACEMVAALGTASLCVKTSDVQLAVKLLEDSPVVVSTVIGFPHGGTSTEAKVAETAAACELGCQEVDMVVNIGRVLSGHWPYVFADIQAVVEKARTYKAITKVIFETGLIPEEPAKIQLCMIATEVGAAFVKTSTGFGFVKQTDGTLVATGATEKDIQLMAKFAGVGVGVKASGGIRSYETAQRFVELGATRLGTSNTLAILAGERGEIKQDSQNAADISY